MTLNTYGWKIKAIFHPTIFWGSYIQLTNYLGGPLLTIGTKFAKSKTYNHVVYF
jgi:hypothetical protein